ncbi:MAG: ParB/RepB/Spo0J family partition protein [Phycisphaeraceae bacterium]
MAELAGYPSSKPQVILLPPAELADFPEQAAIFTPASEAEAKRLRDSMEQEGQRDPIVVLPPGNKAELPGHSIVDGHGRRDAAVALGWSEVHVIVRDDLADADIATVSKAFLDYNANRRQLSPLDQAIVLVRRHEIETGRSVDRWDGYDINTVTADLEPFLEGRGNKTARRNAKLACLPAPIVQAYRSGRLKLTVAEKVFSLKPRYRNQIADAVADATRDNPDGKLNDLVLDAVHALIPKRESRDDKLSKHLRSICNAGEAFINDYDDRIDRITHPSWGEKYLDAIAKTHEFLGRLREQLAMTGNNPDPLQELGKSFSRHPESTHHDTGTGSTTSGEKGGA